MKKLALVLFACLFIISVAMAQSGSTTISQTDTGTTRLNSKIGGLSLGFIKVGTTEVGNLAWNPDFKFGPLGLGLDVNVPLGQGTIPNYQNVVIRYAEYDDGTKGLRYGVIDSLTWGHGLLVDGYSTRLTSSILLNNEQLAWLAYYDGDAYVVRGLNTRTGINGVRVEERINPMLTLGQTYITDVNGVTITGTTEVQKATGVGLDATMPLPYNFEGYAEYAQLIDHGSGLGAGINWGMDFMIAAADFSAGYRLLDSKFVPGYFNSEYETNPINLASAEATGNVKNGYLIKMGLSALGLAKLNARYENYNDSQAAVYADLFAKLPQDMEVTGYYQQPSFVDFRSLSFEQGAIVGGSLAYPVNPFTRLVIHYKKAYNTTTQLVEESQYYEMKFSF